MTESDLKATLAGVVDLKGGVLGVEPLHIALEETWT